MMAEDSTAQPAAQASTTQHGYGVPVAAYVVIASMVGVSVLTTSGFAVAAVGSNQLMLLL
jgi:hypothetical protein